MSSCKTDLSDKRLHKFLQSALLSDSQQHRIDGVELDIGCHLLGSTIHPGQHLLHSVSGSLHRNLRNKANSAVLVIRSFVELIARIAQSWFREKKHSIASHWILDRISASHSVQLGPGSVLLEDSHSSLCLSKSAVEGCHTQHTRTGPPLDLGDT